MKNGPKELDLECTNLSEEEISKLEDQFWQVNKKESLVLVTKFLVILSMTTLALFALFEVL